MPIENLLKHRLSLKNHIYHLVATTYKRRTMFDNFNSARIVINEMKFAHDLNKINSIAWVVMPDHIHWLLQLNDHNQLAEIMRKVKGSSAFKINQQLNNKGEVWQRGYYEHQIRNDESLIKTARYIVANPLRANLVTNISSYPHWDSVWLK
ncbi:transposase [Colwelliaceae bacterium BS250]